MIDIRHGDCLAVMKDIPENSIDAVVTDPPYELSFMGKSWDASGIAFCPNTWREVLRVMKPGAHLVAFGAPKNYHRLACAIEDAGFEIRDSLMWVFGSGFPKSLNISKAIDKASGAEREVIGVKTFADGSSARKTQKLGGNHTFSDDKSRASNLHITAPATNEAKEWEGWGTALKPAYEPIVLARKPLSEKTIAANVLRWGTGALNIDATRVDYASADDKAASVAGTLSRATNASSGRDNRHDGWQRPWQDGDGLKEYNERCAERIERSSGRWPANLCHDGSQGVLALFPHTKSGSFQQGCIQQATSGHSKGKETLRIRDAREGDEGSAARFFYCAKASKQDRAGSKHPTVKPINLMRWLIRMVTPPNGLILDPFAGSGTTGAASKLEVFNAVLIERELEYFADIKRRLEQEII